MYKVAIIGLGKVGSTYDDDPLVEGVYTHAGAYNINPETKITAGADIDREKMEAFGKKWNVNALYSDYSEMFKNEELDIISVCTGVDVHYDIIKEAARYDIKAIYCEKPMTDNIEKADEIVDLCEEKKIVLAVNHLRRWDKGFQSIKKHIDEKKIENVQKVKVYYTKGILNNGSHAIDLLNYFFGDVEYLWSDFSYGKENLSDPTLDIYLIFKNGISGVMLGLNADYFSIFEIDILGTKGRISIKDMGNRFEYYNVQESDKFSGYKELFKQELTFTPKLGSAMPLAVSDILECIKTGKKPLCSGDDARNSLAVIFTAIESANSGGKELFLLN